MVLGRLTLHLDVARKASSADDGCLESGEGKKSFITPGHSFLRAWKRGRVLAASQQVTLSRTMLGQTHVFGLCDASLRVPARRPDKPCRAWGPEASRLGAKRGAACLVVSGRICQGALYCVPGMRPVAEPEHADRPHLSPYSFQEFIANWARDSLRLQIGRPPIPDFHPSLFPKRAAIMSFGPLALWGSGRRP